MQGEGIRIREAGRGVAEDVAGRMEVPGVRAKKDALNLSSGRPVVGCRR